MLDNFFSALTIEEKGTVGGSFGTTSWSLIAGTHTGFIQPIGGGETFRDGAAGEQSTHRAYVPIDTPGEYGNRITQNSQAYIILYAIQPTGISSVGHHKEFILGVKTDG